MQVPYTVDVSTREKNNSTQVKIILRFSKVNVEGNYPVCILMWLFLNAVLLLRVISQCCGAHYFTILLPHTEFMSFLLVSFRITRHTEHHPV